jgi:hypothetical protein
MELELSLADGPIAGHNDPNFVPQVFDYLRESSGDICKPSSLYEGFNFTRHEENIEGFRHNNVVGQPNCDRCLIIYKKYGG